MVVSALGRTLRRQPWTGLAALLTVLLGLAIGHSAIVLQRYLTGGVSVADTIVAALLATAGFKLLWVGLRQTSELRATVCGYVAAQLIWNGLFEWTWEYFGHFLELEPVMDAGMPILSPPLLVIQATSLLVVAMLILLGANPDTRCRMFLWFHRNFRLRPGRMTPGYRRQFARITAMETIFLIWFIYLCAITINDPRLIRYDSTAAVVITVGFVAWGLYLAARLLKIRGAGAALRYAIPTGTILWLPVEGFSRWGLYPEIWVKPIEYAGVMSAALALFVLLLVTLFKAGGDTPSGPPEPEPAAGAG